MARRLAGAEIIVAFQVQHAMHEVADQFGLPGSFELARLLHGVIKADEDIADAAAPTFWNRRSQM